jgi:hypothetical protein
MYVGYVAWSSKKDSTIVIEGVNEKSMSWGKIEIFKKLNNNTIKHCKS